MLRFRQELTGSTELISPRSHRLNSVTEFIPFIQERDPLGRLIGSTPKRYEGKRSATISKESYLFNPKKQLLCQLYDDTQPQSVTSFEPKQDELNSPICVDYWKSGEILPKIKKKDISLGELKISKKSIKSRINTKGMVSARDIIERTRIPPIGFYDIDKSLELTKQKQKVAIIFQEHKRPHLKESQMNNKSKENKPEQSQNSHLKSPININNGKQDTWLRPIENHKAKLMIQQKDSAINLVEKKSYFKRIKSREDEEMYLKYQNAMNSKFNEMREKLNILRGSINKD